MHTPIIYVIMGRGFADANLSERDLMFDAEVLYLLHHSFPMLGNSSGSSPSPRSVENDIPTLRVEVPNDIDELQVGDLISSGDII